MTQQGPPKSAPLESKEVISYSVTERTDDKIFEPQQVRNALYEHQRSALMRKYRLDSGRTIKVTGPAAIKRYSAVTQQPLTLISDAHHVELQPGSGKTPIEIVYNHMFPKPLRILPRNANSIIGYSWQVPHYSRDEENKHHMGKNEKFYEFRSVVKMKFKGMINPIAYVCKPQVQFHRETKRFIAGDKVFIIRGSDSLKQFRNMFHSGTINNYDVVCIKYTGVVVSFNLEAKNDDEDKDYVASEGKLYNTTDAVNIIMGGYAFPRAIYDDYDTVKFDSSAEELNAYYVTLVSGTNDERQYVEEKRDIKFSSLADMLEKKCRSRIQDFPRDRITCESYGCVIEKEYMNDSMKLPHYKQYMYVFDNPNDRYIHLMGVMGNADEVTEALNCDALGEAARMLGVETDSVADMFARLLGKSYDAYITDKHVLRILHAITRYSERYFKLLPMHPNGRYSNPEIEAIGTNILKIVNNEDEREKLISLLNSVPPERIVDDDGDVLPRYAVKFLPYNSRNTAVMDEVSRLIDIYIRKEFEDGAAVKRVQDNLTSGTCDVCKYPIRRNKKGKKDHDSDVSDDSDVSTDSDDSDSSSDSDEEEDAGSIGTFIPKCCGIIVCEICFKTSFHVRKFHDYSNNTDSLVGKCAQCPHRQLNIKTDIIYINRDFDMGSILSGFGTEQADENEESEEEEVVVADEIPKIDNPKLEAVWSIYHKKTAKGRQKIKDKMFYHPATDDRPERWMIDPGTYDAPVPDDMPIKILCFAPFTETLRMIMEFCEKHGMNYRNLKGTDVQINDIITSIQSTNEPCILLVNSEVNCSSLNMQGFTDMIEMCDIKDTHKLVQMRGRLQRIGREFEARYHILRYKNEAGNFKTSDEIL